MCIRDRTSSTGAVKVQTQVNKNLIDFYYDYPQCDVVIHYKTPMSEELRASLYPQLKTAIAGKSQKEAANILLNFVPVSYTHLDVYKRQSFFIGIYNGKSGDSKFIRKSENTSTV